ncbi:MAG: 30S ribosomal protein S9 [Gemmataceae bacterium]
MATPTAEKRNTAYYWGTGRRKTAVARVRVCDGSGRIEINGRALESYFTELKDRELVLAPLKITEMFGKVDVFVNVRGGGVSGHAGAACQGIARALRELFTSREPVQPLEDGTVPMHPLVKKLRDSGYLTRDARMKERKKFGLHGARRGTQFSKR